MSKPLTPAKLLKEIENIDQMVIGSITKREGRYFNLNTYRRHPREGKKRTHVRYLLASELAEVQKLVAAGDRFCELMEQYIRLITAKTWRECPVLRRRPKRKRAKVPAAPRERPAVPRA